MDQIADKMDTSESDHLFDGISYRKIEYLLSQWDVIEKWRMTCILE